MRDTKTDLKLAPFVLPSLLSHVRHMHIPYIKNGIVNGRRPPSRVFSFAIDQ